MSAALEASGLGKRYRRTWALRDCNLTVPNGRIAALVGPNGAGKTISPDRHPAPSGQTTADARTTTAGIPPWPAN